eukprot:scaffold325079_cov24-Attheya_sp.AAC.1
MQLRPLRRATDDRRGPMPMLGCPLLGLGWNRNSIGRWIHGFVPEALRVWRRLTITIVPMLGCGHYDTWPTQLGRCLTSVD